MKLSLLAITNKASSLRMRLPLATPRHFPRSQKTINLEKLIGKATFHRYPYYTKTALRASLNLIWLFNILPTSIKSLSLFAPTHRDKKGVFHLKQVFEIACLATKNIHPRYYHLLSPNPANAPFYYTAFVFDGGIQQLFGLVTSKSISGILNNKSIFHKHTHKHNLKTANLVTETKTNSLYWPKQKEYCNADLIFKPFHGNQSRGIERWDRVSDRKYVRIRGGRRSSAILTPEALLRRFSDRSKNTPYIVEERLNNHPELLPFTDGRLAVIRLLTTWNKSGKHELLCALITLPHSGDITDFIVSNFVFSHIDIHSGRMKGGHRFEPGFPFSDYHPDSKTKISGNILPCWEELIDLSLKAHQTLPGVVVVGWDLAITPQGPVIIEGNTGPGLMWHQVAGGEHLGESALADALIFHAERLQAQERAEARRRRTERLSALWRFVFP